jgi:hypothetical protein
MTAGEGRQIDLDVDPGMDTIETGSPVASGLRSLRMRVGLLVAVALVVGGLGGFYLGRGSPESTPPRHPSQPTAQILVPGGGQPPTATGNRCSAQLGDTLQLGLEIVNSSTTDVSLKRADVTLPLAGLLLKETVWGTCGQVGGALAATSYVLAPGATVWLRMTFDVLTKCPAPLPVQVNLVYARGGTDAVAFLGGFSDLGDVPYTGCVTPTQ